MHFSGHVIGDGRLLGLLRMGALNSGCRRAKGGRIFVLIHMVDQTSHIQCREKYTFYVASSVYLPLVICLISWILASILSNIITIVQTVDG